jgi:hypothetical protein
MSPIRVPRRRAYYAASRNEPERLLCWLPREELEAKVERGEIPRKLLKDYPDGVEIDLLPEDMKEFKVEPKVSVAKLRRQYQRLRRRNLLHESGVISAAALERAAADQDRPERELKGERRDVVRLLKGKRVARRPRIMPRPAMSKGEDLGGVLFKLQRRRR